MATIDDTYERVLLVKPSVYVYKIPPITSASRGFRADDWNLSAPDWVGRLRLITRGNDCFLRIEDSNTGDLYCQAPVLTYPGPQVQQVSDSRRYFVVKVVSDSGRSALIGIGFEDRADSFDLNVALQDHFVGLQNASKSIEDDIDRPKLDLRLKTGIRVNLNIGGNKSATNPVTPSTEDNKSTDDQKQPVVKPQTQNSTIPFILPPPPSTTRRR